MLKPSLTHMGALVAAAAILATAPTSEAKAGIVSGVVVGVVAHQGMDALRKIKAKREAKEKRAGETPAGGEPTNRPSFKETFKERLKQSRGAVRNDATRFPGGAKF